MPTMKKMDTSKSALKMKKIPQQTKNQLRPIVQKLLTKCSNVKALTKNAEWDEMVEIFELLKSIEDIEKDFLAPLPDRRKNWDRFYEWCSENGAEFSSISVEEIDEGNFGVKAKKDVEKGESFLTVPRKIMMSEISAKKSKLGPLVEKDVILQNMPNVLVAMHLLTEFLDPKSIWLPYISILPSSYSTVLYFTLEDIRGFQKSPVVDEIFKILRSVIRQYCYFFQLFEKEPLAKNLGIGSYFTYDLYRWAVSATMTRQNILPSSDGQLQVTSLVPLFDMCNHVNGKLSTDFNLENDSLVSYAFTTFSAGSEVYMFYGPRTNAEFVVHNGFIYIENENDAVEIKLGIGKNDPLCTLKNNLCSQLKVSVNGPFYIHKKTVVSEELMKFLEVNVMKADELEKFLNDKDNSESLLKESTDIKKRAFTFLRDRVNLLLRSYGTSIEEDEEFLKQSIQESNNHTLALQLRLCEKRILKKAFDFCVENIG